MPPKIIDLHSRSNDGVCLSDIPQQILEGLAQPFDQKHLPTMILYDEQGLRLYDIITTEAPEYYLFGAEEEILRTRADDIVHLMHQGTGVSQEEAIVELGAGALRKTSHILLGLSRLAEEAKLSAPITYYALDLEQRELERVLDDITESGIGCQLRGRVEARGLWGTYADGLKFIESGGLANREVPLVLRTALDRYQFATGEISPISSDSSASDSSSATDDSPPSTLEGLHPPLHIMFLGSSLGNFSRNDAASFLRSLPLRPGSGDTLLIGLDHDNDKQLIEDAYNDGKGHTKEFILNGLKAAGRALGDENMFDKDKWEYENHYNTAERCHEAFYRSKCAQTIIDPIQGHPLKFLEGERMKIEQSLKFSEEDNHALFAEANLRPVQRWMDQRSQYSLWLLERPSFIFPLLSSPSSATKYSAVPFGVPTREEWTRVWAAWDLVTDRMIATSMLYERPIDLRHICLFYLGHIPTFLDINLSKLLQEPNTEPQQYKYIFERGIDPNVDNPTECHSHSEVPKNNEEWPTQRSILKFQTDVRSRLMKLYDDIDSGKISLTRRVGRVLFMTLEHEIMHTETLLYMLIQRAGSGTLPPSGFIVPPWTSLAAQWNLAPLPSSKTIALGPSTVVLGHDDFEMDDDTLIGDDDMHEFGWDNENPQRKVTVGGFEIDWRPVTNGDFYKFFMDSGKKNELDFPASWVMSGEDVQVRTLYGPVSMDIARHWPVITTCNNLSTYATVKGGRLPTEPELRLFYDKFEAGYEGGANVGFRNWHPIPATTGSEKNRGRGHNGGVWEWTSTPFEKVDGFVPSELYPGYSMDFFDGKHQVVLGGSFATVPRISERRTFRNWYQRNYPYAWIGGRVAYDIRHLKANLKHGHCNIISKSLLAWIL